MYGLIYFLEVNLSNTYAKEFAKFSKEVVLV